VTAPWLSVIVPTYNGAAYLPAALDSVVAQNDPNVEVIALDDGSTDETPSILRSFGNRLQIKVISRRIGNWVANTNLGLEHARGEWVCFLHQDDLWRPGRMTAVRPALAETNPALLLTAAEFITAAGRPVGLWRCPLAPGATGNSPSHVASRLLVQNFVPLPTAVFRRGDALAVGGLDPDLWYTADWDFWLKLATRGSTRYLPQPLAAFRLHPESQTVKRSGGMDDFRRQHDVIWERHWPIWRDKLANPERVEAAARLSVEMNVLLAGLLHRGGASWRRLLTASLNASPAAWMHFVNSSRFFERVSARIRAGLIR
jgi:glycosyltransferase involved in cell wall biosynthesis